MPTNPLFDFAPDEWLKQEDAEALLRPFVSKFASVWRSAWNEWESLPQDSRDKMLPRTRANILQDFAVAYAKDVFADVPGVEFCEKLGFFKMYVGGSAVIRLKRLGDETHLASNIQTEQQKAWYKHEAMKDVKAGCTRLTVGYTLNAAQVAIHKYVVSLQSGTDNLVWSFELDPDSSADSNVVVTPIVPPPTDEPRPKLKVKSKPKSSEVD